MEIPSIETLVKKQEIVKTIIKEVDFSNPPLNTYSDWLSLTNSLVQIYESIVSILAHECSTHVKITRNDTSLVILRNAGYLHIISKSQRRTLQKLNYIRNAICHNIETLKVYDVYDFILDNLEELNGILQNMNKYINSLTNKDYLLKDINYDLIELVTSGNYNIENLIDSITLMLNRPITMEEYTAIIDMYSNNSITLFNLNSILSTC